ncbi:MAG: hypothetical protein V4699_02880 [Patescibacteria group bacterium]
MDKKFTYGNKYVCNLEKKTIFLPVELENLPDKLIIGEFTLFKRSEFHVSLVCVGKIIEKYKISIPDFWNKVVDDFYEFTRTKKIEIIGYKDEFKFVVRENKKTVVVMCEMSNLNEFFDFINHKYTLNIDYPPAHITLYTLDGESGIFLISIDDIKNFTKPITNPIGFILQS